MVSILQTVALCIVVVALGSRATAQPPSTGGAARRSPADTSAPARDTAPVGAVRRVYGRVVHPSGQALAPVGGQQVILHRVGSDTAGPIDSVRTGADGRYAFVYRTRGARDAVYFASSTYDGIAYLSQPLSAAVVRGDEAEIIVYDTTSHEVPLRVRGRHLVVSAPAPTGRRSIIEVFELSNDTSVTVVSPGTGTDRPTWSLPLPPGAQGVQVGQGDISADAVSVQGNRIAVFAPFAPGLKQMSFSYSLSPGSFPLARPLPSGAIVFEVLLEETGARASGIPLRPEAAVTVEGRLFKRFVAQDVPAGSVLHIRVPVVFANGRILYIAVVITVLGAVMLGALALAFRRRTPHPSPLAGPGHIT